MFNSTECPFCGNSNYTILSKGKCPKCGRLVIQDFCNLCGRDSRFSVDYQRRGCWRCKSIQMLNPSEQAGEPLLKNNQQSNASQVTQNYTQSYEQNSFVSEREREFITREFVYIPCSHCGALMNQTETACSNCGAHRKL